MIADHTASCLTSLGTRVSVLVLVCLLLPPAARTKDTKDTGLPTGYRLYDRVRATVDDQVITQYELHRQFEPLMGAAYEILDPAEREKWLHERRMQVLDQLIDTELILREAKKLDLEVSPADIANYLNRLKADNSWTEEQLLDFVKRNGFRDMAGYHRHVEKEMLKARTVGYRLASRVRPSKEELDRAFKRNYYGGEYEDQIRAQHIFIRVPPLVSGRQLQALSQRAQEIRSLVLAETKSFAELASGFTDDKNGAQGGDLGYFRHCEMTPEFEKEAFKLKVGEISEVVRTSLGFHIIRVVDRRKIKIDNKQRVLRCLQMNLEMDNQVKAYQGYTKELRLQHHVLVFP
ncbi:MAG: peptidylprolyl isomerase [Myxococcota bacterium]|nr:peptidylprolyl isomerase [Myxococcota bacterium]